MAGQYGGRFAYPKGHLTHAIAKGGWWGGDTMGVYEEGEDGGYDGCIVLGFLRADRHETPSSMPQLTSNIHEADGTLIPQ